MRETSVYPGASDSQADIFVEHWREREREELYGKYFDGNDIRNDDLLVDTQGRWYFNKYIDECLLDGY